jgi:hypothetical protein
LNALQALDALKYSFLNSVYPTDSIDATPQVRRALANSLRLLGKAKVILEGDVSRYGERLR